ncbi:MAG: hypothetical protein ACAH59_05140 [Pseudobdellovibrionaceae bacterium]
MKTLIQIAILACLLVPVSASADMVLVKKSQVEAFSEKHNTESYDSDMNQMAELSDKIADSIMNRERNLAEQKKSPSKGMFIRLVKVKRTNVAKN